MSTASDPGSNADPELERLRQLAAEGEARCRTIVAQSRDAMLFSDRAGRLLDLNPAACTLFGVDREAVVGRDIGSLIHGRRPSSSSATRLECHRPGGGGFSGEVQRFEIPQEGATIDAWIVRDITRRHELEARFVRAQMREAVARFAATMAHSFHNDLAAMRLVVRRARTGAERWDAVLPLLGELIERSVASTRRLSAVGVNAADDGGPLHAADVLERLEPLLRWLCPRERFDLRLDRPIGPLAVETEVFQAVVVDLVLRLSQPVTDDDQPALVVEATAERLDGVAAAHRALEPGNYLRLAARRRCETGRVSVGPPELGDREALDHLLGACGGLLEVGGSTNAPWVLWMPLGRDAAAQRPAGSLLVPTGATALIVDDNPLLQQTLGWMLDALGFASRYAATAEQARRLGAGTRIDLVLCDVHLPDANGDRLSEELRALWPDARFLLMTGAIDIADMPGPVLRKPFTLRHLQAALARVGGGPSGQVAADDELDGAAH